MQFDDRLATVLRMRTGSMAGERTQFRQLLDLLGTASPQDSASPHSEAAYARLAELRSNISADEQAQILREAGLRLRNPQLVEVLASGDPRPAASAMATARLSERQWEALIPRLPITARGFLRHRRDLPMGAQRMLKQLGVGDLVLSDASAAFAAKIIAEPAPPAVPAAQEATSPITHPANPARRNGSRNAAVDAALHPIGAIIERIEQYRTARRLPVLAPRLPLGDAMPNEGALRIDAFDAVTDAEGRAVWASGNVAPWVVGMLLANARPGSVVQLGLPARTALRTRQPLHSAALTIVGAPAISGEWRLDASPSFVPGSGAFAGYRCRAMRAVPAAAAEPAQADTSEDRMRQVLHELRTPVNAIQGFAEIIQQQLFGSVPHEYRAHAAAIAVDAARLLAGFEDLDRLAQLESGTLLPEPGQQPDGTDMRRAFEDTLLRLESVLRARGAGFAVAVSGDQFTTGLERGEALALCWRLLASAAGALAQDEQLALKLASDGCNIALIMDLPAALRDPVSQHRGAASPRSAVSAGMFGPQFAFRLAAAEARNAGGSLEFMDQRLTLTLPVLTVQPIAHSR